MVTLAKNRRRRRRRRSEPKVPERETRIND
jgi:hypothetical protein